MAKKTGLWRAKAIGEAHRRYTRFVNFREGWRGYLWQGRFASFPMERPYALACARYIELNPVRAKLVKRPEQWPWSSALAHLKKEIGGACPELVDRDSRQDAASTDDVPCRLVRGPTVRFRAMLSAD